MIGKISKPVIGKLTGIPFSGDRSDGATSPRSPLDFKIQSPRGPKSFNHDSYGVGLAIVAALHDEKTNYRDAQHNKSIVYNRSFKNSIPIPLRNSPDMDSCEDYTIVTCRGPDQKLYTKVYGTGINQNHQGFVERRVCDNVKSVFDISPAKFGDYSRHQDSDFLSSCHLCHKKLHGKDIYMYRGEKAFCSTECRYSQIVMDEHKEKYCGSEISRSADIASSPYANGQMFSTGILAI